MIEQPTFTDPDLTPEGFAATWGADPVYMQAPNLPADGYMFYNFAVEQKDPEFLRKFAPAIERTIEFASKQGCVSEDDIADLEAFLE